MSELTDALQKLRMVPRGPRCSVGLLLEDLEVNDPTGHELLVALLDNDKIAAPQIIRALSEVGILIQRETIVRHRRRAKGTGCRCAS